MEKVNIIQFMPYFPPHKGGVETVGQDIGINWKKSDLGGFLNVITSFEQEDNLEKNEKIIFENEIIGYKKDYIINLVIPSFEIINNFPIYKFWDKKTRFIFKYLKLYLQENKNIRVITHTRFFLPSLFGGIFARKNNLKWIHIEHGSDYVKLSSKLKTRLSIIYDKIFGKWIFKKADNILAISEACKNFINKEFIDRDVNVFYRGLDIPEIIKEKEDLKEKLDIKLVFIGRLVSLKGVDYLIESYKELNIKNELIIIGDGEEKQNLEKLSKGFNVKFLGFKNREFIIDYLSKKNCIVINPSYSEGMPTTVIEGLLSKNIVIASDVGGTKEISINSDLLLFEAGNKKQLKQKIVFSIDNYDDLKGKSYIEINTKFSREQNIINLYNLIK
ncbi:glycosyltransferase family 4 protein [Candidatus Gracilibacteria bacterium]|nr:glycosyltransferase family 4 protein [Candidatus Gracilibacteria bacterium]